jgi:ADP-heptose:LPS heptosyltransferase
MNGRIVTITRDYTGHGMDFRAGAQYVVEDPTLGHLLMMGVAGEVRNREVESLGEGDEGGWQSVLVTRSGGFGDILFLTPLLRTLVAAGKEVTVCCHKQYRDALSGVPKVKWANYPMGLMQVLSYDREAWLEGVIEFAEEPERPAVDLLAEAAGVELTEGKELSYAVMNSDLQWALEMFPRREKYPLRVGLQLAASSPARTYPQTVAVVEELLAQEGVEVALFGKPGTVRLEHQNERILNVADKSRTFGQSGGVLSLCDVVVAPDSALAHMAGALKLPTVALYGPFPWQARTSYAPTIRALSGHLRCAPCYWHGRGSAYPPHGPCSITGRCEALGQIEPSRVVREVLKLAENGMGGTDE